MGWSYVQRFEFNQNDYTAENMVKTNNRLQSFSPTKPGSPIDSTKATSSAKVTNTDKVLAGKSDVWEKGKRDAIQHGEVIKGYIINQGFCATFSLIWIEAILLKKTKDERKDALIGATKSYHKSETRLERIAALYVGDQVKHAKEAGLNRTNEKTWKGKPEDVQKWLFEFVSNANGWKTGAWNLTRQRTKGRHRLGLYCDGQNLYVFNPTRGEWCMSPDKDNEKTPREVFFKMIGEEIGRASCRERGTSPV